jgi:hypothetical protein
MTLPLPGQSSSSYARAERRYWAREATLAKRERLREARKVRRIARRANADAVILAQETSARPFRPGVY